MPFKTISFVGTSDPLALLNYVQLHINDFLFLFLSFSSVKYTRITYFDQHQCPGDCLVHCQQMARYQGLLKKYGKKVNLSHGLINQAPRYEDVRGVGLLIYVFLTSAVGVEWAVTYHGRLTSPTPAYLLRRSLGRPQNRSGGYGDVKILDPIGTRNSKLLFKQRRSSLYTD